MEKAASKQRRSGPSKSPARPRRRLEAIHSWDDVPVFASEDDEAEFWATHALGDALLDQMRPIPLDGGGVLPPARPSTASTHARPISVRLDDDVLRRLKALAVRKNQGYQTLLKQFVVERVYDEEKREGII